jgi:hypothetical protein
MDTHSKEGTKVIVTKFSISNGYTSQIKQAKKHLKVGGQYTVDRTEVSGWHTNVFIKEFPDIAFNSVLFEDIPEGIKDIKNGDPFLIQTAVDYDMSYNEVKNIREKHPDRFYPALEDFINNRAETNS